MLIYKNGDCENILGFQCDRCNYATLTDVIPNRHGEFRYTCPKCGAHMKELTQQENKEEKVMMSAYTVANAAKRLNCSTTTIIRGIYDGRFHDCFTETGYTGKPAWMIPSDQVEGWVTSGGFLQGRRNNGSHMTRKAVAEALKKAREEAEKAAEAHIGSLDDMKMKTFEIFQKNLHEEKVTERTPDGKPVAGRYPWENEPGVRKVFDPEVGKEVPVLNFLGDLPVSDGDVDGDRAAVNDEFMKRVVRRVAKDLKPVKEPTQLIETDRNCDGGEEFMKPAEDLMNDIEKRQERDRKVLKEFAGSSEKAPHPAPVVRTDDGFSITIPKEVVDGIVKEQVRSEISGAVTQLRAAFDLLNEQLKKLEEVMA